MTKINKVVMLNPSSDFAHVAKNAAKEIAVGLIIGYDSEGELVVFGGGLNDGRSPTAKDFLWMIETFKKELMAGHYDGSNDE